MFLMWLGEQITSRGIGNGISLIIMAGIVAHLPTAIISLFEQGRTGAMSPLIIIGIIVVALGLIAFICFMERAQRKILIQYPKRQRSEEHTSELQSLMRISYAVFCLKKKRNTIRRTHDINLTKQKK